MKFEQMQPGTVLYDVRSYRMGNTSMRSLGTWSVRIVSIDRENRCAMASWNTNPAERYSAERLEKLKDKKPVLVRTSAGSYRRPTREEMKAMKEAA